MVNARDFHGEFTLTALQPGFTNGWIETLLKWFFYVIVLFALVAFTKSLFVLILVLLAFLFMVDWGLRRQRNYISSFNSTLRAVSRSDAPLIPAANAFSKSGPLRHKCREFSKRLGSGEPPLEAAVAARLPLEISTALTLESEDTENDAARQREAPNHGENAIRQSSLSVSCQFFYLSIVSFVSVCAMLFFATFIQPTLETMYKEFSIDSLTAASAAPSVWGPLVLLAVSFSLIILPLFVFSGWVNVLIPKRWFPLLPNHARPDAIALLGIAAGMDAGVSLQHVCRLGKMISRGKQHACFTRALQSTESGARDSAAIAAGGWLNAKEAAWLDGAPPQRMSALMRSISLQNLRTAYANLNWLMAFLFPAVLLGIAAIIAPWAYSLFYGLNLLSFETMKPF